MCQVLCGEPGLLDGYVDLCGERVEGALEGRGAGAERGERSGQAGTQETIVGAGEEQGDAEAEVGDPVSMSFWEPARSSRADEGA